MKWYALVDCNSFYASCEQAFVPALQNKPVVVLSNNDGCVIARSKEAKALGIGMGTPYWEVKNIIKRGGVKVFSSNYPLYGSMSKRVMGILHQSAPEVEVYSIDEAFLKLEFWEGTLDVVLDYGHDLRQKILKCVHLPTCIGIGTTKTLCKLANRIAKKYRKDGVYALAVDEFRLLGGPNISTQFSSINGKTSHSSSYTYILEAKEIGSYFIPPASIEVAGNVLETQPLEIWVVDKLSGTKPPAEDKKPKKKRKITRI